MPRIDAIDISHWQDKVDFPALAESGIVGVIHKCTEGTGYRDEFYGPRMTAALAEGLRWGAYHFLKHGDVAKQMNHFIATAKLPKGSRAVIDYEDAACELDDLEEAIGCLVAADPTLEVCVYCGGLLKGQVEPSKSYPWLARTSLWLAQYGPTPEWPRNVWTTWSLWQFTDSGEVVGVEGPVDCNTFNGSQEACEAWFGPVGKKPGMTGVVTIDILTSPGVEVVVLRNGDPYRGG